jgi:hypothetical protein
MTVVANPYLWATSATPYETRGCRIPSALSPSIGIIRVQADIFDGGSDGKLWRGEFFRQQKQWLKGLGDN